MKTTKKLTKAKNGIFKKREWTNTVSPDEETVTSRRAGMRGSTVNVVTDAKTGKKLDRYRTPGLTPAQKKANEVYAKNPIAAKEDDFKPFTTGMKSGGVKYKTGGMTNSNKKVTAIKKATGKVGGTSTAPKSAVPKAKRGMIMRKK